MTPTPRRIQVAEEEVPVLKPAPIVALVAAVLVVGVGLGYLYGRRPSASSGFDPSTATYAHAFAGAMFEGLEGVGEPCDAEATKDFSFYCGRVTSGFYGFHKAVQRWLDERPELGTWYVKLLDQPRRGDYTRPFMLLRKEDGMMFTGGFAPFNSYDDLELNLMVENRYVEEAQTGLPPLLAPEDGR